MTRKEALRTADAPQPAGPYSQAIVSGDLLFTAGFGPQDPATGDEAYREFFTEPFPVRTTVGSQLANILVEIDLVARLGE